MPGVRYSTRARTETERHFSVLKEELKSDLGGEGYRDAFGPAHEQEVVQTGEVAGLGRLVEDDVGFGA